MREILTRCSASPPMFDLRPKEDIAAIEYTAGTTGFTKGAMLTHYNLVANAIQNATWFGWNSQDVIIGALPFYHSWGACTCVNSPIYTGARVIIFPRFDIEELLMTIEQERATVLY
ncbi:MAG: AMP-binding protein, partial [Dehalococcoidia bacterium]|nr:AMP-binding protein [Dehalococcoidia bacterium]